MRDLSVGVADIVGDGVAAVTGREERDVSWRLWLQREGED